MRLPSRQLVSLIAVGGMLILATGAEWCSATACARRSIWQLSQLTARQSPVAQMAPTFPTSTPSPSGSEESTTTNAQFVKAADWLTYYSPKFGYAVDYPKTDNVYQHSADGKVHVGEEVAEASERFGVDLRKYLGIPEETTQECAGTLGVTGVLGVNIDSYAIAATDMPIGTWVARNVIFYERQALDPTFSKDTAFHGEPAYYFERALDTYNNGLCALTEYFYYFFHNGNVYEISGVKPPTNPTDLWKKHPLYSYLVKSVPITEAIVNSFRFVTSESTSTVPR